VTREAVHARTKGRPAGPARPEAEGQAEYHAIARQARSTATAEDYVEAVADLIDVVGEARVTDLAKCLAVTHVTVVRTVARLQRDGLLTARPYRSIFLTGAGRTLAEQVRQRHAVVLKFLAALGVSAETARADAEGIEHHVSRETLAAMERFVRARGPV
jgi:DtxR family manganese transport transcriptional regulator